MPLKKEVCEQIKAILVLICMKFFLTYKPSEAFVGIYNTAEVGCCSILRTGNIFLFKKPQTPLTGDLLLAANVHQPSLVAVHFTLPRQNQAPSSFRHSLQQARLLPALRPHSFPTLNRVCLQKS